MANLLCRSWKREETNTALFRKAVMKSSLVRGTGGFLLLVCAFSPPVLGIPRQKAETVGVQDVPVASDVLIQAYLLGKEFVPEERASLLRRLGQVAVDVDHSLGKLWCEELFRSAFDLPPVWNRLAFEKNALVTLSQLDPVRAMELFDAMDSPISMNDGNIPEDVRADAARTVFVRFWRQTNKKGLPQIRSSAMHLGDTGQYPFGAMASIIRDVAETDPNGARALFAEALGYYRGGARIRFENLEFIEFLQGVRTKVDRNLMREALQKVVSSLTEDRRGQDRVTYYGTVATKSGSATFNSFPEQLLFEVFDLIEEVDKGWAESLREHHPELRSAGSGVMSSESAHIYGDPGDPSATTQVVQRQIDETRAWRVSEIAVDNTDDAVRLASSISDPRWRSVAFSRIAAATASSQPNRSADLLQQGKSLLSTMKDHKARLSALTAYAEAAAASGRPLEAKAAIDEAFPIGEELFQEDLDATPGKLAYAAAGYDDLTALTRTGAGLDSAGMLARITTLRNVVLRAFLLVEAADGIARKNKGFH